MHDLSIAFFVSAHGFGHAARAAAVMAAIRRIWPSCAFRVYSTVPAWFFDDPDLGTVTVRSLETDVGVAQKTPLVEDPEETLHRLNTFYPLADSYVRGVAQELNQHGVDVVVADIAPLGIAAAGMAGLPSVLVENFTWDWIYGPYQDRWPGFERHIRALAALFDAVDVHIQATPVCRPVEGAVTVAPVSREARTAPQEIRRRLGLADGERMVLLTLGGTPVTDAMLSALRVPDGCRVVAPGLPDSLAGLPGVVALAVNSGFYHPDLIRAADAVIGKAGYSTLAEIYRHGVPYGFFSRPEFREAPSMEAFILSEMIGRQVPEAYIGGGDWRALIEALVAMGPGTPAGENGADAIAQLIVARYGGGRPVSAG